MAKADHREDAEATRERWGRVIYWLCTLGAIVSALFMIALVPIFSFSEEGGIDPLIAAFGVASALGLWVLGWIARFWLIERHKMPK